MEPTTKIRYCSPPETIAARLRSVIEGSVIEVNGDQDALWIAAIFEAPSYLKAYSRIGSVLFDGLECDEFPAVHLQWAPNVHTWALARIRDGLVEALPLRRANGTDLSHKVSVRTEGFTLKIHVCTAGLFDPMSAAEYGQLRESWFRKVDALDLKLPKGITGVSIQIGDVGFDWTPQPFSSGDDDDGDDGNPNWPSRTGNPSGTGRGNNPARR